MSDMNETNMETVSRFWKYLDAEPVDLNQDPSVRGAPFLSSECGSNEVSGPVGVRLSHADPDYADLFENAPVGYMMLDPLGCIQRINRTGAEILGWDQPWLEGKPFSRWVTNIDKQLFHAHQRKVQVSDNRVSQEICIKNRQGRIVSLRLESIRESGPDQDSSGCRSILIDISGEMKSQRKLRRLQSQLSHLARLNTIGELAASLAHDLNQPLGIVTLNCDTGLRLLRDGQASDPECAEALKQASEAAAFANQVVMQLRRFLRNDGDHGTPCEIRALIEDVSKLIEAEARDNDVELCLDIEPDLPLVHANAIQIEQVLLNLAHNSIEAMQENSGVCKRVTLRARSEDTGQVHLSVEDTGPGLSAKQLNQLFTPFYTTKIGGMGLGLSISRTIVEAHGGRLWPAGKIGSGATIHFTLPVSERPSDAG